jgi:hypothetical protein
MTFIDEKVSPNGKITVYYQSDGPRLYRVNGVEVPSVTTVAKVIQQIPQWSGMRKGIQGMQTLARDRKLPEEWADLPHRDIELLLTANKLCVNTLLRSAGKRGTSVHRGLEQWATTGVLPDPADWPPEERGYVLGLNAFLEDLDVEITRSEVMVGSVEHGFAGRFDLRAKLKPCSLCVDMKKGIYQEFDAGTYLMDLKTSKVIADDHLIQVAAYEGASIECGWPPTVGRLLVRVSEEGGYEVRQSYAEFEDFLFVLDVYRSFGRLRDREKAAKKAAKDAA